jgi:hypothetical protein
VKRSLLAVAIGVAIAGAALPSALAAAVSDTVAAHGWMLLIVDGRASGDRLPWLEHPLGGWFGTPESQDPRHRESVIPL